MFEKEKFASELLCIEAEWKNIYWQKSIIVPFLFKWV